VRAFPKPDSPDAKFWESQKASMRADAVEEYKRLLIFARKVRKDLLVRQVVPVRGAPPFFEVAYAQTHTDPKNLQITKLLMGIKTFIHEKDARRFMERALYTADPILPETKP